MDAVYLFFENENIRIPFYNYDKGLFTQLVNSRLGHWVQSGRQYSIPRSKYDRDRLAKIFSGRPFVEVDREPDNPVIVNGFFSDNQSAPQEIEPSAANAALPETRFVPDTRTPAGSLSDHFFDTWREKLETELRSRKYSPHTRTAYVNYNQALCQWLQKTPDAVTNEDIKRYLAFLEKAGHLSASSINLTLSAIKFFHRHVLKNDNADEHHRPRQDKRLPVVLSKAEIKKMIAGERNTKHRLLLMMVYASGLRVSEAVSLKRQNVDTARKSLLIVSGKGRKDRYTIMSETVVETLTQYFSQYKITGWLFPGADTGKHLSIRSAQHICEHALKKANIQKTASIHSLRHSFATHLLESGTDISYIKELLGHASVRTTERYTHVARRKTLKIISPLDTLDRED